jgi:hypothetical protein
MHTTLVELLGGCEQRLVVELPQRFKARVHVWRLVLVAMLGFTGLGLTGGAASAGSAVTFANTPASGWPGCSITVSSITPCPRSLSRAGFFLFAETLRAWVGQLKDGPTSLVGSPLVGGAAVA